MSYQFRRLDSERIGELSEHGDACGNVGSLDCTDVACAEPRPFGQIFLRQFPILAGSTQIRRHDLFEIHGERGAEIGMIIPGTIVPIRRASW